MRYENSVKIDEDFFLMTKENIYDFIKSSFPNVSRHDWLQMVDVETQKKNFDEVLSWKDGDGQIFFSYYDRGDVEKFAYLNTHRSNAGTCSNIPLVTVDDESNACSIALDHLTHGADGAAFDLRKKTIIDFDQ